MLGEILNAKFCVSILSGTDFRLKVKRIKISKFNFLFQYFYIVCTYFTYLTFYYKVDFLQLALPHDQYQSLQIVILSRNRRFITFSFTNNYSKFILMLS